MTIEPDTTESLLARAIEVLLGLLPPQWTVERGQGPAQDDGLSDERFFVKDRGGTGRPILVDARLRTTPAELDKAYNDPLARRMRQDAGSPDPRCQPVPQSAQPAKSSKRRASTTSTSPATPESPSTIQASRCGLRALNGSQHHDDDPSEGSQGRLPDASSARWPTSLPPTR